VLNKQIARSLVVWMMLTSTVFYSSGCHHKNVRFSPKSCETKESYFRPGGLEIEYPDVATQCSAQSSAARMAITPLTLDDPSQLPTFDLSLPEAIGLAVGHSPTLRSLGANVVQTNGLPTLQTVFDPALAYANPLNGVEAALSDFDAQYTGQLFWQKNDQPVNQRLDPLLGQFNPRVFQQNLGNFRTEVAKTTATGARFAMRHSVLYDRNNRPTRQFESDYTGFFEAEYRQPLLQGAGTLYNRIAGPNSQVGQYNGVLIARINSDVALTDFEAAVVRLVSDVEQSYWNLYFSYRNLDALLRGRESALQTYQYQEVRLKVGAGRSDEEAQAQSQFFQFQSQVENALAGQSGLYVAEQNLRYMLGLPASDGRLIRPTSDPMTVRVSFDWDSALQQSLERRVEIRRQQWNLKRRELELCAAKLNRKPRLDYLGLYRWRGLGDHLVGSEVNGEPLDNLYGSISDGNYQEWQSGVELSFPVGLRRASVAISHAQLQLAREKALLNEIELRISHDLSNATRELARTLQQMQTNLNRWNADLRQVDVLRQRYRNGADNIAFLLQAQRLVVNSQSDYFRSVVEYNLAMRNFHQQKGSLLAYNQVYLTEGPWANGAAGDAYDRGRFFTPHPFPNKVIVPRPVSAGTFDPSATMSTQGDGVNTFGIPEETSGATAPQTAPGVESKSSATTAADAKIPS
jgi:outer membrane protein TolC